MQSYRNALVASSASSVMKVQYPSNRALMAPGLPAAAGFDNIETWYKAYFKAITLNVTYGVNHVVLLEKEKNYCFGLQQAVEF